MRVGGELRAGASLAGMRSRRRLVGAPGRIDAADILVRRRRRRRDRSAASSARCAAVGSAFGRPLPPATRRIARAADVAAAARRRSRRTAISVSDVGPRDRHRRLPPVLRAGLGRLAALESVEQRLENLRRQVLVGVLRHLDHRRVHAGAEALDLLPGEIAVGGDVMLIVMDALAADVDQVARAAQHAGRRAADLDVRLRADRLEMEHRVEGRDLEHADLRHAEHRRRRPRSPAW